MKNLLLIIFLFVAFGSFAQTTFTITAANPYEITAPDNTNTHIIQLPTSKTVTVHIKFPSGNAGTIQVNGVSSTLTNSPALSNTTDPNGIVLDSYAKNGYKIYFRATNANDKLIVTIWTF